MSDIEKLQVQIATLEEVKVQIQSDIAMIEENIQSLQARIELLNG